MCSMRCHCYPCCPFPMGTGSRTLPHPRSPPSKRLGAARNAHVVGEENPAEAAARELPARAGPRGGAEQEEGTPGGSGQPTRTARGDGSSGRSWGSGSVRPRGSHVPAGVPSALSAFSPASPACCAERPCSWKWDGKSPGSPQSWGAQCLRSQEQRQHLAVTPAAPAGALWPSGAFLPRLGSDCALCMRSRAQKRGEALTKMKVQGKKHGPARPQLKQGASCSSQQPVAQGRAFARGLPLLPGMLPARFLAA